jgi:hypothetical protein
LKKNLLVVERSVGMGAVYRGIPIRLVELLLEAEKFLAFVETGTYLGETARWAGALFPQVFTVEVDKGLYDRAREHPDNTENIRFINESSASWLRATATHLPCPALFWLDAHYSGPSTGLDGTECPVIDEIKALRAIEDASVLIDDARMFLGPPGPDHDPSMWPRIDFLFALLAEVFPKNRTTLMDDVIVCVPGKLIGAVDSYWLERARCNAEPSPPCLEERKRGGRRFFRFLR